MKSLGLALTLFSLTGALAALDLSGAHRVEHAAGPLSQSALATPILGPVAPAANASDPDEAAADDDEADSEVINTFLVTPRLLTPANGSAATLLRYD